MNRTEEPTLTTADVAELLETTPRLVRVWTIMGLLPSHVSPQGNRRYKLDDVADQEHLSTLAGAA